MQGARVEATPSGRQARNSRRGEPQVTADDVDRKTAGRSAATRPNLSDEWLREILDRREAGRGKLIAFEGPNGSGKTTQRKLFRTWLESEGRQVVTTKWASSPLVKPLI